jgi:hypothetical protein
MCTHVYTSHQHYYSSLPSTRLPFFLAGWLILTLPVGYNNSEALLFISLKALNLDVAIYPEDRN